MGSAVIWFTGYSGAGKSALAKRLAPYLEKLGHVVESMDGDVMRAKRGVNCFTRSARLEHLKSMAEMAADFEREGKVVIGAFITPYEEARTILRDKCHRYIEVWIDTPLEVCEERDVKGLYGKARKGEISNFTGVSDIFEKPLRSEIHIQTNGKSEDDCFLELTNALKRFL